MAPKHYVIAVLLALLGATLLHALVCPSSTINPTSTDVLMIEEEYDPTDVFIVDPRPGVLSVGDCLLIPWPPLVCLEWRDGCCTASGLEPTCSFHPGADFTCAEYDDGCCQVWQYNPDKETP